MRGSLDVRVGAALAAASALLALPGTARALSCATNAVALPRDGDIGVPTDAILWGYYGYSSARLIGPGGAVVATDVRAVPVVQLGGAVWGQSLLVPRQELQPNTQYTIENRDAGDVTFTTGAGPTSAPPRLPVLLSSEPDAGRGFGGITLSAGLEFEHEGILLGDVGGLPAFTSVDELFLDDPSLTDQVVTSPGIEWLTEGGAPPAGRGDCMTWPEGAGERASARFGVLDLAGNFSGWVDVEVRLPNEIEAAELVALHDQAGAAPEGPYSTPSACSTTSGSASGTRAWLTLALAGVLHATRRFRRPSR